MVLPGMTTPTGIQVSNGTMFVLFVIVSLWLASGFAAATFSEVKNRTRLIHFIGGLVFPFIYPAFVYFALSKCPEKAPPQIYDDQGNVILSIGQKLTQKYMEKTGEKYVPTIPEYPEEKTEKEIAELAEEKQEKGFNQQYFSSIASDEEGNFLGPYIIELNDGRFIEAIRILDTFQDVFELEIMGAGDEIRKIRLPYSKIIACEHKEKWSADQK